MRKGAACRCQVCSTMLQSCLPLAIPDQGFHRVLRPIILSLGEQSKQRLACSQSLHQAAFSCLFYSVPRVLYESRGL